MVSWSTKDTVLIWWMSYKNFFISPTRSTRPQMGSMGVWQIMEHGTEWLANLSEGFVICGIFVLAYLWCSILIGFVISLVWFRDRIGRQKGDRVVLKGIFFFPKCHFIFWSQLFKLDSPNRWINPCPVDGAIGFPNTYPLDSEYYVDSAIQVLTTSAWCFLRYIFPRSICLASILSVKIARFKTMFYNKASDSNKKRQFLELGVTIIVMD